MRLFSAYLCAYICALAACHTSEAAHDDVDLGPSPNAAGKTKTGKRSEPINPRLLRRFRALEPVAPPTDLAGSARIALGQQLYFDKRLSAKGDTSCDTCHSLAHNGAEPRAVSVGSTGLKGTRNAPTVYNAAWHVAQFWDGREPDVERQAMDPILGSTEMAMGSPEKVTAVLRSILATRIRSAPRSGRAASTSTTRPARSARSSARCARRRAGTRTSTATARR